MRFFSIGNIEELDFNKLVRQLPGGGGWNPFSTRAAYIRAILECYPMLQQYEINTPARLAHFLGQGLVETGCLQHKVENLNYSAQRLRAIFPGYFRTDEIAREYERKPERIANRVYSDRLGNGPPESGDGWRYRGRGFFQLTGRENYRNYGQVAGFDLENDPEIIERDLKKSLQVAAAYFQHVGLGAYADRDDCAAVSRGVNRGNPAATRPAHGEADRILWTNRALDLVKDPQALLARAGGDGVLRNGASGDAVRTLQRALTDLGYAVGAIDGIYGPATRRAVLAFQDEHGLPTTGAVDEATQAALNTELAGPPEPAPAPTPVEPAPEPTPQPPVSVEPAPEPAPAPEPEPEPAPPIAAEPAPDPQPAETPEPVAEAPTSGPIAEAQEPPTAPVEEPIAELIEEPAAAAEPELVAEAPAVPTPETTNGAAPVEQTEANERDEAPSGAAANPTPEQPQP